MGSVSVLPRVQILLFISRPSLVQLSGWYVPEQPLGDRSRLWLPRPRRAEGSWHLALVCSPPGRGSPVRLCGRQRMRGQAVCPAGGSELCKVLVSERKRHGPTEQLPGSRAPRCPAAVSGGAELPRTRCWEVTLLKPTGARGSALSWKLLPKLWFLCYYLFLY